MWDRARPRGLGRDDGFTLVELLLVIVILGVISIPLSNVVIGYLRNSGATTARLLESHDVQVASAYWAQDVASIGVRSPTYAISRSVEQNVPYNSGDFPCGYDATSTTPSTPNAIVRLAWDDFRTPGLNNATSIRVAYVVVRTGSGATQQAELHRLRCEDSATVVSDVTLTKYLDTMKLPVLACLPSGCTAPGTVTLTLSLKDPNNPDGAWPDVTLTGQWRQTP